MPADESAAPASDANLAPAPAPRLLFGRPAVWPRISAGTADAAAPRSGALGGVLEWLRAPPNALFALILLSAAVRLAFASMMGLGVDESYMVVGSRSLQLSYFDHPPLSWWLTWGAAHLFGSEANLVVRLPFIALFGVTTWLMYKLGETLLSTRAGLWAAVALNLSPVFGVTTASWVLPDGPLDCALLGLMVCLTSALRSNGWRWWIGVGLCGGLALLSKYTAVLTLSGVGLYLLTQPQHRRWLLRPGPYLAGVVAVVTFSPVLIWNSEHRWVSFLFQGGRAAGLGFSPLAPFVTLGGEALFVAPWIWAPLMLSFLRALRRGPSSPAEWMLCCVGAVPIGCFSLVALWSNDDVLFHWAAPGYLMLFPLLGSAVARQSDRAVRPTRFWLFGSAIAVVAAAVFVSTEVRWNWLPDFGERFAPGKDPDLEAVDWTSLRVELAARRIPGPGTAAIAALGWRDAGKLAYALGPNVPVICLCADAREFGILHNPGAYQGRDVLIVAPDQTTQDIRSEFGSQFDSITALPPLILMHGGRQAMVMPLFLGHHLHISPEGRTQVG